MCAFVKKNNRKTLQKQMLNAHIPAMNILTYSYIMLRTHKETSMEF